jgi:hypothetical protein
MHEREPFLETWQAVGEDIRRQARALADVEVGGWSGFCGKIQHKQLTKKKKNCIQYPLRNAAVVF